MDTKELRGLMEAYSEVYAPQEEIEEASYSAKAARAGKDIGKPGKAFAKIAKEAGKRYGSKERGEKVAGAVLAKLRKEGVDIFDIVLEFLQAEGFAETLEEAEWLMANVIDEEAIGIILGEDAGIISGLAGLALGAKGASYAAKHTKRMRDYPKNFVKGIVDPRTYGSKKKKEQKEEFVDEAQHARENPEKYEREQDRKYEPVRGEKTPMPPRGDKRREDFEKWYAKQMGR